MERRCRGSGEPAIKVMKRRIEPGSLLLGAFIGAVAVLCVAAAATRPGAGALGGRCKNAPTRWPSNDVTSTGSRTTSIIVLVGVLTTPFFVGLFAHSFSAAARELTIQLVRILFPGAGLLVLSAWCLGVLNSHHRFLLSYSAGVAWNAAMIATLIIYGRSPLPRLAIILAWGSVVGRDGQADVGQPRLRRAACPRREDRRRRQLARSDRR